jgi:hypothetical protein
VATGILFIKFAMSGGRSISGERRAGDKFGSFTKDSMVVEIEFVLSGESEAVYCRCCTNWHKWA